MKKTTKSLGSFLLDLVHSKLDRGAQVEIKAQTPYALFQAYNDNISVLKEKLEDICDIWIEELGENVHNHFTKPNWSFTPDSIYLIREYSH